MDVQNATIGVTGAGGFIGGRLLERLAQRGATTVGLELSPKAAGRARSLADDVIVGDVRDRDDAAALARRVDVILHTAAIVGEGGRFEPFRDVNVRGTRQIAARAAEFGVRRLVHLSSVMVYGFDFPPEVDESGPLRGEDNPYCQTKIESEIVAGSFHGRGDLEVTILRPGDIYGPGSQPWVVRPLELMRQGLFMLPDGGEGRLDPTWIDNLVDAIFLLLEDDHTGEPFNVTDNRTVRCREFFRYHADMLGKESLRTAPSAILKPLFSAVESIFRLVGAEPPGTADAVEFLSKPHGYSSQKIRDLGHVPRVGLSEGMREVETWARQVGLIPQ